MKCDRCGYRSRDYPSPENTGEWWCTNCYAEYDETHSVDQETGYKVKVEVS